MSKILTDWEWNRKAKQASEAISGKIREAHTDYLVAKEAASDKKKAWAALIVELQETVEYYSRYGPGKEAPPPRQGTILDIEDVDDDHDEPKSRKRETKPAVPETIKVNPEETTVNVGPTPATAKPLEPETLHGIPVNGEIVDQDPLGINGTVENPKKPGDPFAKIRGIPLNEFEKYGCPEEVLVVLAVGKVKRKGKVKKEFHEPLTNYGELLDFRKHMSEYKLTDFHGIGEESAALFERAEQLFLLEWEKSENDGNIQPGNGNPETVNSDNGQPGSLGTSVPRTGSEAAPVADPGPATEPVKKKRGRPAGKKPAEAQVS